MKQFTWSLILLTSLMVSVWKTNLNAAIVLQPHQKIPVQYLMKNPDQKGLLLYHSLGSGKTYIALDYAERNPDKKVLILLPEFLKSNWLTQMQSFGVKNMSRYELMTLDEIDKISSYNLKDTILIIDEVHKLVQKIKLGTRETSDKFIHAYLKLKTAFKLLLLTGTPIFIETSDIAYIGNLLAENDPYPVNPTTFKNDFMRIKPLTSLVRGQITESKLMMLAVPFFVTLTAVVTLGASLPWAIPLLALPGAAVIPVANEIYPANQVAFREFDAEKWKNFSKKYISYYNTKLDKNENYPDKKTLEMQVLYNEPQTHFFLNLVEENLNLEQLKLMLAEESVTYSDDYLKFHSFELQKQILGNTLSGREIGNLDLRDEDNHLVESPKFLSILNLIKTQPGQVAIYSNYFQNGIVKFAAFLDRQGMKNQYTILNTKQSMTTLANNLAQYNQGQKRIILIHPEITEGISLIATEQFHVLEPINNSALLEQVIGRSIRYQSHIKLPKERQVVNVYLWQADVQYSNFLFPTAAGLIRRKHWQKNYSEVNPSMWTKGILDIDKNYFLKDETPDSRAKRLKLEVQKDVISFQALLDQYSIEK